MDLIFLACGGLLLVVSFFGIMRMLLRLVAIFCLIAGVFFWYNGGRERIQSEIVTGKSALMGRATDLVDEEKKALESALANPGELSDYQKPLIRQIVSKLSASSAVKSNKEANTALENLKSSLEERR